MGIRPTGPRSGAQSYEKGTPAENRVPACEEAFLIPPGIVQRFPSCPPPLEGVAHHFVRYGMPTISTLNVQALAIQFGLPNRPSATPSSYVRPKPYTPPSPGLDTGAGYSWGSTRRLSGRGV